MQGKLTLQAKINLEFKVTLKEQRKVISLINFIRRIGKMGFNNPFFCAPSTRIGLSNKIPNPDLITADKNIKRLVLKKLDSRVF